MRLYAVFFFHLLLLPNSLLGLLLTPLLLEGEMANFDHNFLTG